MPEITKETHEFLVDMLYRWVQGFYDEPGTCGPVEQQLNRLKRIAADVGVEWSDILEREEVTQFELDRVAEKIKKNRGPKGVLLD